MKKFKKKTMNLKKYAKALKKIGVKTSPKEFSKWFYSNFTDANHEIDDHLISDGLCIVKTICINDCSPCTPCTVVIPEITRKGAFYFLKKYIERLETLERRVAKLEETHKVCEINVSPEEIADKLKKMLKEQMKKHTSVAHI